MDKNFNILIIDDDKHLRDGCKQTLIRSKYIVKEAENGKKGLELLKKKVFDIVILDLKMPGMNGMEVLKKIRDNYPETVVVIITGYATIESAVEAMKIGASDFLPKPFTPEALRIIIKRMVEKRKLLLENIYLREQLNSYIGMDELIGNSEPMIKIKQLIKKVGPTDSTVLISGESGTGKELVARAIHQNSSRRDKPFVTVDCGSLVENLFESELFGHVKGSFTGAISSRHGKFELANTGTLFFDEIGNISTNIQAKLLRAIQESEITKVGGTQTIKIDVRIISATNINLVKAVGDGSFREDLFYRLAVIPFNLPSLRVRKDDIPILANYFLKKYNKKRNKKIKSISQATMKALIEYDWPGNIRELQNTIERSVVLAKTDIIEPTDIIHYSFGSSPNRSGSLALMEKEHILKILNECNWNKSKTAQLLKIDRKTLRLKIEKYKITTGE
ncbi:MAG TPA: sigma-54-dependent Fis family transcriptional regulator [Candidatus Cloacimonetes bacterium]|nr:sigma-54-dependent Fis family transcriptional regulator [Candidatus Cloacimonadota bacterium]